jgi:hypothetical protein
MRKTAMAAAITAICSLPAIALAGPASPLGPEKAGTAITLIAGGCGIGFHRGPYGGCVANGPGWVEPGAPVGAGPRAVVGPRGGAIVCPPGYHLGPQLRLCWPI